MLFWCFCLSNGDLTRLVMLFSGSKQHSKPGILLFWSLLFFYYAFFMVESNWYYVLFSFFLPPTTLRFYLLLCIGPSVFALIAHAQLMAFCILRYISHSLLSWTLTIIIILVHWVERVCSNRTRLSHGRFAYDVEYTTLPLYWAITWPILRDDVALTRCMLPTYATLLSIKPSIGRFYGMLWPWQGICSLHMPLSFLISHQLADSKGWCGLDEVYVTYLCHFPL